MNHSALATFPPDEPVENLTLSGIIQSVELIAYLD